MAGCYEGFAQQLCCGFSSTSCSSILTGGQSIWGGYFEDEFVSTLKHERRGCLSMVNTGPNTNGSQFFITYARQPHLNGVYTTFGRLIDGLDTLDKIEKEPVNAKNKPQRPIKIESIVIHANPIADEEAQG
ncbi:unnamed protein product [Prorocentrum cordatum]|uniref:Peptidyl-prolyl cis-trans isomerase n=1 Tax=Prorocentrum cordatum TaxID=2364126 RepID=A0ABN9UQ13_9DINO|nr:unnamed protein product [Polarella glacialis]